MPSSEHKRKWYRDFSRLPPIREEGDFRISLQTTAVQRRVTVMLPEGLSFASRFDHVTGSAIREIFKVLTRPNMISFAG